MFKMRSDLTLESPSRSRSSLSSLLAASMSVDAPAWRSSTWGRFWSYLNARTFCVHINSIDSTLRSILAGVLQGSDLGLDLFKIFTHNLTDADALFAGDVGLITQSWNMGVISRQLQQKFDRLHAYLTNWCIFINASRYEAITVS